MIGAYKCLEIIWVPKRIWADNTKMDIKGKVRVYAHVWMCVDLIQLAESGCNGRILLTRK
jgi:hypothetical protein